MATRPFAYNPSHTVISGTTLLGDLSIGVTAQNYTGLGGLTWWNGPDESTGYIICVKVATSNWSTPVGNIGTVKFWRSGSLTDASFIDLVNNTFGQTFSTVLNSLNYLNTGGHWTSYPPVILYDTNTIAWYDSTVVSSITKDAYDYVSIWADKLGSGHNLLQTNGSYQPIYNSNSGINLDANNKLMSASFTYDQPQCIYSVVKVVTYSQYKVIFGKVNAVSSIGPLLETDAPNSVCIKTYEDAGGGTHISSGIPITYGQYYIIRTTFDTTSTLTVDNGSAVSVVSDNIGFGGLDLGRSNGRSVICAVKEIICRKISDTTTNSDIIYAYLKAKYSL